MKENKQTEKSMLAKRATYAAPQAWCYEMEAEGILATSNNPLTIGGGSGNNGHQDKGYGTESFATGGTSSVSSIIPSAYNSEVFGGGE